MDVNQYLWLRADLADNTVIFDEFKKEFKVKKVSAMDYCSWLGFAFILMGVIIPFIQPYSLLPFLFVPIGIATWAIHILTVDKALPAGTMPGHQYYKYKISPLKKGEESGK